MASNLERCGTIAVLALALSALPYGLPSANGAEQAQPAGSNIEEIYVLRSLRETRVTPTEFCGPLTAPTSEDYYTFHTLGLDAHTGRAGSFSASSVGHIRGCFGKAPEAGVFLFYGEFEVNGVTGKARGDCKSGPADFPEQGLRLFACYFLLSELPAPYAGGQLTTNSVNSKNITGEVSDPSGYIQVSVATVRLWKRRADGNTAR